MMDDREYFLYWDYYVNKEKNLSKVNNDLNMIKNNFKRFKISDYSKFFWPNFFKSQGHDI